MYNLNSLAWFFIDKGQYVFDIGLRWDKNSQQISKARPSPVPLTPKQYDEELGISEVIMDAKNPTLEQKRAERTFNFVVETRKFEIDLYWRRATYFWAFIAVTFAGYITLVEKGSDRNFETLLLICVGFLLSCAWHFTNLGSKVWQRHWEKHLDLLEDPFIGPLYKTVNKTKTFSVSKINSIVSFMFCILWVIIGIKHLHDTTVPFWSDDFKGFNYMVVAVLIGTILAFCSMFFGYGRGRFRDQTIKMYRRKYSRK